jgi:hypothetical protein
VCSCLSRSTHTYILIIYRLPGTAWKLLSVTASDNGRNDYAKDVMASLKESIRCHKLTASHSCFARNQLSNSTRIYARHDWPLQSLPCAKVRHVPRWTLLPGPRHCRKSLVYRLATLGDLPMRQGEAFALTGTLPNEHIEFPKSVVHWSKGRNLRWKFCGRISHSVAP